MKSIGPHGWARIQSTAAHGQLGPASLLILTQTPLPLQKFGCRVGPQESDIPLQTALLRQRVGRKTGLLRLCVWRGNGLALDKETRLSGPGGASFIFIRVYRLYL